MNIKVTLVSLCLFLLVACTTVSTTPPPGNNLTAEVSMLTMAADYNISLTQAPVVPTPTFYLVESAPTTSVQPTAIPPFNLNNYTVGEKGAQASQNYVFVATDDVGRLYIGNVYDLTEGDVYSEYGMTEIAIYFANTYSGYPVPTWWAVKLPLYVKGIRLIIDPVTNMYTLEACNNFGTCEQSSSFYMLVNNPNELWILADEISKNHIFWPTVTLRYGQPMYDFIWIPN